jgi:hypothetical protein
VISAAALQTDPTNKDFTVRQDALSALPSCMKFRRRSSLAAAMAPMKPSKVFKFNFHQDPR